jgi:hypothetical protein
MIELSKDKFDAVAVSQYDANQLCWATSIQLILNYFDILLLKENIVNKAFSRPQDNLLINFRASDIMISNALNIEGTDYRGIYFKSQSKYYQRSPTNNEIKNEINSGRPMLIVYNQIESTNMHAVVLVGFDENPFKEIPLLTKVVIRDPCNDEKTTPTKGRKILDAEKFIGTIYSFWTIEITK